jgi:hypothetical protein
MSTRIIKINRGDSFELPVIIPRKDDYTKPYFLTHEDALYFALMYPNQRFEDAIFVKGYTLEEQDVKTGEIIVKIIPNDTIALTPGVYYYTAKLQRGGNLVVLDDFDDVYELRTVIERTKFIINE